MELKVSSAWQNLQAHYEQVRGLNMRDLFEKDLKRFERFSLQFDDILLDYSKNRITDETMKLLMALAREADVEGWREQMFSGEKINHTEGRAVLHTALRSRGNTPVVVDGVDVMQAIREELKHMRRLSDAVRSRQWRGFTGQPITDVVNIGIGGSDLGPMMVTEALHPYGIHDLRMHFVSNVDESHIQDTLEPLNPATTLFILSSKSFTTQETLENGDTAREWFLRAAGGDTAALQHHFIAVTANYRAAQAFGIVDRNIFRIWDWVGGRYSLWSAIGLPIAIYIGMDQFEQLLEGAYEMDTHFREAPLEQNVPVILGMLGVWYNNFFNAQTHAVLPYDQHMQYFPAYLQQADMESNGKSVDRDGKRINWSTGPVIFGEIGIKGQHAFYQLLHQGTKLIPADILAPITDFRCIKRHHRALMSNVFAQAEALMKGKNEDEARAELKAQGLKGPALEQLLPYKIFEGNKPTNTIIFDTLTPKTLGRLIAMYEQKIFVQGIIWRLNSFDQWGVELGKQLARTILHELDGDKPSAGHDSSTNALINYYKTRRPKRQS